MEYNRELATSYGKVIVTPDGYLYIISESYVFPSDPNEDCSIIRWHKFDYTGCRLADKNETKQFHEELNANGYEWDENEMTVKSKSGLKPMPDTTQVGWHPASVFPTVSRADTDEECPSLKESGEVIFILNDGTPLRGRFVEYFSHFRGCLRRYWYAEYGEYKSTNWDCEKVKMWCYAPKETK